MQLSVVAMMEKLVKLLPVDRAAFHEDIISHDYIRADRSNGAILRVVAALLLRSARNDGGFFWGVLLECQNRRGFDLLLITVIMILTVYWFEAALQTRYNKLYSKSTDCPADLAALSLCSSQ